MDALHFGRVRSVAIRMTTRRNRYVMRGLCVLGKVESEVYIKCVTPAIASLYSAYIRPLFAGKHGNQFGIGFESLKVVIVVDFRAVRVQVDGGQLFGATQFLGRLHANLLERGGHNGLFDVATNIFNLFYIYIL